jgi:hypothetical protein
MQLKCTLGVKLWLPVRGAFVTIGAKLRPQHSRRHPMPSSSDILHSQPLSSKAQAQMQAQSEMAIVS